jgi:DNA-binding CsgD family transcriptional regulator
MRPLHENELEALRLFANGKTPDEMAMALGLRKSVVQHCLRVAARKLGARNRVHAVAIAVKNGLVKPIGGPQKRHLLGNALAASTGRTAARGAQLD